MSYSLLLAQAVGKQTTEHSRKVSKEVVSFAVKLATLSSVYLLLIALYVALYKSSKDLDKWGLISLIATNTLVPAQMLVLYWYARSVLDRIHSKSQKKHTRKQEMIRNSFLSKRPRNTNEPRIMQHNTDSAALETVLADRL